jgi:hypothetical protein
MLGLETVTGSLDHFGFEDFLNGDMTFLSFFFCCLAIFTFLFPLAEVCMQVHVVSTHLNMTGHYWSLKRLVSPHK